MRLLLDTHVLLWWLADHPRLGRRARAKIARADVVFVSVVSVWEIAIKVNAGKLRLPAPASEGIAAAEFSQLSLTFAHAERVVDLPRHHADPFDRMLIAQAHADGLTVVTADEHFAAYGVPVIAA